ncbi:MAG TPA: TM2 domain-containing protein [Pseudomonadales bacterium]|nr:TM2 domain-containing protein [Pseudomonadales bacterium]
MFEAWTLRSAEVAAREEALRERIRRLDDDERRAYWRIVKARLKDPDTYAVLDWFLLAGIHHFYLGHLAAGTLNLVLMLIGVALLFTLPGAGLALITLILVAELPALFRSQLIVADHNVRIGEATLRELRMA